MKSYEASWESRDRINLALHGWEPEDRPKAAIALVHGLGDHTGRYEQVARVMTDAGYTLVGFDLRGHGQSGGIRGHFPSLGAVMTDIDQFLGILAQRYPEQPRFLYGHSMGGLLVLTYALMYQPEVKGVIATSTGLRSPIHEQRVKAMAARLAGSLLPTVLIPSGLETAHISQDPSVVQAYRADPLTHDRVSLGLGKAGLHATDYVWSHAEEFSLPLLIMHGSADRVTYASGSKGFARLASKNNRDVTWKLWNGLYHELHHEPQREAVLQVIVDWLDEHL